MKEARYFFAPDASDTDCLPDDEAKHATRVLRLTEGDEIFLLDGKGCCFRAIVTEATQKRCRYRIESNIPIEKTWNGHFHLAIAPTKMSERIEWMAEKATEIGFDELSFVNCQYSERQKIRTDRIERIVVSAVKQSRKAWKPIVNEIIPFNRFVQQKRSGRLFIAHCYEEIERKDFCQELLKLIPSCPDSFTGSKTNDSDSITILIGPEGDFSIDEVRLAIENGYTPVSLGQSRLRTETAGLSAVIAMQMFTTVIREAIGSNLVEINNRNML